jgi:hypothetical protein
MSRHERREKHLHQRAIGLSFSNNIESNDESHESLLFGHSFSDKSIDMKSSQSTNDFLNIAILLFLYILQGIPLGLAGI